MSYERFAQARSLSAATAGAPAAVPAANCDQTCHNRRNEFAYVAYVGKQIYCYWDLKKAETGTDFDQLAASLEASITSSTSTSSYFATLRRWASAFHDGHVNAMLKDDMNGIEYYTAPIRVEVLAPATDHEKLVITAVSDATTGVSVGDEIIQINGFSAKDALTRAAAVSSSGSTERMRRYSAGRRLVDVLGIENGSKPLVLILKSAGDGSEKKITLYLSVELDIKRVPPATPEDTGLTYFTARILANSIGYLRLDAFEGSQDDFLISQAMDRLSETRGLVLDLRQNGGGDLSGDRIIERLTDKVVTRYKRSERLSDYILSQNPDIFPYMSTPDASGLFAAWHDLPVAPVAATHYGKPVVALISPYCFSACDTFSAALKVNHLATFVGEPTGGGTGTPLVFDLPLSPFQFRYSVIRGETAAGDWIEGHGTFPDVYAEPTVSDRARQKDGQLEKAIAQLESQISGLPSSLPVAYDLSTLPKVWSQSLDRSPTLSDNDFLVRIGNRDERR